MKTTNLATRGTVPGRSGAASGVFAASATTDASATHGGRNSAGRQQKIEERIAAATEELASGITQSASAAEELRRAMEQIAKRCRGSCQRLANRTVAVRHHDGGDPCPSP
jgi:methyl-accepting chemotaxis protein